MKRKECVYDDIDNIDYVESCISSIKNAIEDVSVYYECEDICNELNCVIEELKEIKDKLNEKQINQWNYEASHQNHEYMASRGITGLTY